LTTQHPLLRRAKAYLERLLAMRVPFPDPPEKNPRWQTGWRLFTAATLARIAPQHWAINPTFELWSEIALRTFARGRYDPAAELEAHRELTAIDGDLRYLHINNVYALALLGARSAELPTRTQTALLRWLFARDEAMIYLPVNLRRAPPPRKLVDTLRALEILSAFAPWRSHAKPLMESINSLPRNRLQVEIYTRVLSLLRRYIS
jgi:hypothetical protein